MCGAPGGSPAGSVEIKMRDGDDRRIDENEKWRAGARMMDDQFIY
jgi:hypothetical protein